MVKIDIELPIYCYDCPCHNGESGRCKITGDSTFDKRPFDCPLKEVKLADLPSAQPERPKGKWIPGREIAREYGSFHEKCNKYSPNIPCHITYENYKCSCCGLTIDRLLYDWKGEPFYKFCPNCGADMREEEWNG